MNDAQYLTQVTPEAPVARRDLVNRWVLGFAIANVVAQIGFVFTQGIVSVVQHAISVSEYACNQWPYCDDITSGLPFAGQWVTLNTLRWTALLALLGIGFGLLFTTARTKPTRTRPVRIHTFATLPLIGFILQMGLQLTTMWFNPPWIPVIQAGIGAVFIFIGAWLVIRLGRPDVPACPATGWSSRLLGWSLGIIGLVTAWLGIISAYLPDHADTPLVLPTPLANQDIAHLHTGLVIVLVLFTVIGVVWAFKSSAPVVIQARRTWLTLLVLLVIQGGLGLAKIFLKLPMAAMALHLLGSTLVLMALVGVLGRLYVRVPVLSLSPRTG